MTEPEAVPPELVAAIAAALRFRSERGMGPGRLTLELWDNGQGVVRRWEIEHKEIGQPRKCPRSQAGMVPEDPQHP